MGFVQTGQFLRCETQGAGGDVLGEVVGVAGAGDGQDVRALGQAPGEADLGGGGVMGGGHGQHRFVVGGRRAVGSAVAGDGEERNEGDALVATDGEEFLGRRVVVAEAVAFCTLTTGAMACASAR